jgi:hypothetical protein
MTKCFSDALSATISFIIYICLECWEVLKFEAVTACSAAEIATVSYGKKGYVKLYNIYNTINHSELIHYFRAILSSFARIACQCLLSILKLVKLSSSFIANNYLKGFV